MRSGIWMTTGLMLALAACGGKQPEANVATPQEANVSGDSADGVSRDAMTAPTPTPIPAPAAAIQTQPGPNGSQVALTRAAVTGDVLTVQFSYTADKFVSSYVPVDRVTVIDDATAQQISVLKDAQGNPLAAPLDTRGKELRIGTSQNGPTVVWLKFPAPPATSKTISINIPEVGPFDGVPVTR